VGVKAARWRRRVAAAVLLPLVVYAVLLALLAWRQEALLFPAPVLPADFDFGDRGADVRETWVEVPGARLHALHLQLPQPRGIVFFLHGNGGSLDEWFVNLDFYRREGFDLFMIDYRGYGKSSGHIDGEAQLMADVRAAWHSVAPRYAGLRRVFFGRSLGTGLAAKLAAEVQPESTLLVSPYYSLRELAAEIYPWVPGALLRYPLRTDLALPKLAGEVWLVHGERDGLIAPAHSRRLQALLPRAHLVIVPGAGHNDLQQFEVYANAVARALQP
jgi:uncharacterized protein